MLATQPNPVTSSSLPKKEVCLLISFVDDFVTLWAFIGQVFLKRLTTGNRVFRIPGTMKHWTRGNLLPFVRQAEDRRGTAVDALVETVERYFHNNPDHVLKRLEITGHGYPAEWSGRLSLDELSEEDNHKRLTLTRLKPYWSETNEGVILRMCFTAKHTEGQQFLRELAKTIGSKVVGWTGVYEIHPTGEEWTATPEGQVLKTGDTCRVSLFDPWRELPRLKKMVAFPGFIARMAWRTVSGR